VFVNIFKKRGNFMAVIRVQKTENYTVMSNHHLRNKELSLKAKGLISLMLSLPPDWDYSVAGLVAICKESHTSVRSALKELEEQNYLIRERKNSEKGYFVYEYTLYEVPEPHTGKQHAAKRDAENTHTENRSQLSKEKLNTNKLNKEEVNKESIYIEELENILKEEVSNEGLQDLYLQYIEMREGMEAPLTARGLKMLIQRCERLAHMDLELQKALVEAAIINNWKNVYLPNEQDVENNTTQANLKRFYNL
jgi:predicted transcriptional regulator